MIDDSKRTEAVLNSISNNTDYSLIEKMSLTNKLNKLKEFQNYILILAVLIEKSRWSQTASALLIKKIYNEKIYCEGDERNYGKLFLITLKEKAVSPYTNTSSMLNGIIKTIIYDRLGNETSNIIGITKKTDLLESNEFFLQAYLNDNNIDNQCMSLYYNCIDTIDNETNLVRVSKNANSIIKKKILSDGLISYLKIFIRPLYVSANLDFEGASYHVPEPFYKQIFSSYDEFQMILNEAEKNLIKESKRSHADDLELIKQIQGFMVSFVESPERSDKFVDIHRINFRLNKNLHTNARL